METTREELYKEIWKEAVSKVAIKYGVSDQAIRKKCKKLNIPLPSNKYWGDFHAGKNPKPDPLPSFNGDSKIDFCNTYEPGVAPVKEVKPKHIDFEYYDDEKRKLLVKIRSELKIKEQLYNPHPEIIKHKAAIKEAKRNYPYSSKIIDMHGSYIDRQTVLDAFSTSEQTMLKAYLFLDALMKSVEKAGGKIEITKEHSYFIIEGEKVFFRLKEKYNQVRFPADREKDAWRDYQLEPSGLLRVIVGYENVRGQRYCGSSHEFKETGATTLDKLIANIFTYIFEQPHQIQQVRVAYEKYLEEERHREIVKRRLARIHDNEFERVKELIKYAKQYDLSQMLIRYLDHLRESEDSNSYIAWVTRKIKWLDPTDEYKDTILNEKDKEALIDNEKKPTRYNWW